jgi:hypothetical protein
MVDVLLLALTRIAANPCLDPEGNADIARKALKEYWDKEGA